MAKLNIAKNGYGLPGPILHEGVPENATWKANLETVLEDWSRGPVDPALWNFQVGITSAQQNDFEFYLTDVGSSFTTFKNPSIPLDPLVRSSNLSTVMRLFGVTTAPGQVSSGFEESVPTCVNIHGFMPSLSVIPRIAIKFGSKEDQLFGETLTAHVNANVFRHSMVGSPSVAVTNYFKSSLGETVERPTVRIDSVRLGNIRSSLFQPDAKFSSYLDDCAAYKITISLSIFTEFVREALKTSTVIVGGKACNLDLLEKCVPQSLKFMGEYGISVNRWLRIPGGVYYLRDGNNGQVKDTTCQLEIDVHASHLSLDIFDVQQIAHPNLRLLAIDIETVVRSGPLIVGECEVIQVGLELHNYSIERDDSVLIGKTMVMVGTCDEIEGTTILEIGGEEWKDSSKVGHVPSIKPEVELELLRTVAKIMVRADPDMLVGHNIINFDFSHMYLRVAKLAELLPHSSAKNALFTGRLVGVHSCASKVKPFEKMFSGDKFKVDIPGRTLIDTRQLYKKNEEIWVWETYSLKDVATRHLPSGMRKIKLGEVNKINQLQEGSSKDRKELAEYCMRDTLLTLSLSLKPILSKNEVIRSIIKYYVLEATEKFLPMRVLTGRGSSYCDNHEEYLKFKFEVNFA